MKLVASGGKFINLDFALTLDIFEQKILRLTNHSVVIVSGVDEHGFRDEEGEYHDFGEIFGESSLHNFLEYKKISWVKK
jgi:hypothetical protein